jgi:hypothetical protein
VRYVGMRRPLSGLRGQRGAGCCGRDCGHSALVATAITNQLPTLVVSDQVSSKLSPISCQARCSMVNTSRHREGRTPTMTIITTASPPVSSVSDRQDRCEHRGNPRGPRQRCLQRDVPLPGWRHDSATSAPAAGRSLPELLDELVELGREVWRIRLRERAVRAEIEALREIEENHPGQCPHPGRRHRCRPR